MHQSCSVRGLTNLVEPRIPGRVPARAKVFFQIPVAAVHHPSVVHVRRVDPRDIFVGNGRDEHHPRTRFSVERLRLEAADECRECLTKRIEPLFTSERFVETERGKDDISSFVGEMLIPIGKVIGSRLNIWCIARPGKIAHHQLVPRIVLVQECFQIAEVLQAVEQVVAYQGNAIARLQLKRKFGCDWLGNRCAWGGRFVDAVLRIFGIFGPIFLKVAIAKFTRTLGVLIRAGVNILSALEITGKICLYSNTNITIETLE